MRIFSIEHQTQVMVALATQVGGIVHLYGFLQQPHTVAALLATRMTELEGGQILIRTADGLESWESWHWTISADERQEAITAHYGPGIGRLFRTWSVPNEGQ